MSSNRTSAITALLLSALALPAMSDGTADEAELHFQIAAERYVAKDFRGALEHFLLSNRLVPNRNVGFNIARTYEQLGRFADAHRYYVESQAGETDPKVLGQLDAAIRRIAPNVAVLDVVTTPPGAIVYIDRKDLGSRARSPALLAFPSGKYKVIASLEGYQDAEATAVEAVVGSTTKVELVLERIVGQLQVESDPGTEVRLGEDTSAPACVAPCTLSLAPGPYTVFLTREGHQTQSRQAVVTARQTTTVRAVLSPLTGSLVISTDEREAVVEIDGRSVGFTPVVVPSVPVGPRKVRISLRGFAPIEQEVTIQAGQQTELVDLRLDPIREVTAASRFSEPIEDAPSSVTIVSRQELLAFGYPTVAEALRGVRGMSLSNDSIYSSVTVRGLGQPNDYGNRLLVLSDGAVLNDDILSSSYLGYDGRTHLHDVERIEIVRGAGSVLYGTGAVSGVVNLVTRERDAESSAYLSAGSFDDAVARVAGGFNYRFSEDSGLWASVGVARSDGRELQLGDPDGVRTGSITGGLDAFVAGTTAGRIWWGPLTAQWLYTSRDLSTTIGAYGTRFGDPGTHLVDTRGMLELRFEPRLADSLQLLLRAHANLYRFSGRYAYEERLEEVYEGLWLGTEARLVLTPLEDRRALRLTLGGAFERHLRASLEGEEVIGGDVRESYLDEDQPFTIGAVYGLIEGAPIDALRISAGARLDIFSTVGASFSPRLAVIVKPWEDGVLKLLAGRAFRAPSVYELLYNDGGITQIASPDLEPETSYSGEIEYSHRVFEDWIALASVHTTLLDRIIETRGEATMELPLVYANSDEQVLTLGGDVELRREWRQGWMISLMYGYQRPRYLDVPDGFVDDRVINAPDHIGAFKAAVPLVPGLATLATRVTVEGPRRTDPTAEDETEPSVVADVILSGEAARFHLRYSLGLYNLLDQRYSVPITEGAPTPVLAQSGRTLLFELTLAL